MPPSTRRETGVAAQLSRLDRLLPVWIFVAMGMGIGLGRVVPALGPTLDTVKIAGVSLPIAVGLAEAAPLWEGRTRMNTVLLACVHDASGIPGLLTCS